MTADEDDVWAAYVRGVKPIGAVKASVKKLKPSLKLHSSHPNPLREREGIPPVSLRVDFTKPLDRNLEKRLRQGAVSIDARIDLHGMKQDEAHDALERFLEQQIKNGRRCLLVITGKGRGNEGVLRSNLGKWLAASLNARQILALRSAALKHGGTGAFYVMLRRRKE